MNERIRELEQQARFAVQDENGKAPYDKWRDKFAELIVRECAELVKDFYQEDRFTCYGAETEIKDHFGIE